MFKKQAFLVFLIVFSLGTILHAQSRGTIVFVFEPYTIDPETGEPPDMTWIYFLEDAGYEVIPFYNESLSTAEEATLDTLNNANLIIVGRRVPSLVLGDHKEAWNGLTTPLMTPNVWGLRSNRLNWFNTTDIMSVTEEGAVYYAIIEEADDPVFDNIDMPGLIVPWVNAPFDAIGTDDAGFGIALARLETDNTVLFARFEPDVEFYVGAGDYPSGHRTLIGNGTDVSSGPPFNYFNFTDESAQVFLAEVAYMVALGGGPDNAVKKETARPTTCFLAQNYPNPFNPTTKIEFMLSEAGHTTLQVFNIQGKLVGTLADHHFEAGRYTFHFAAEDLSAGIYYYRIRHDGFTDVRKMILLK